MRLLAFILLLLPCSAFASPTDHKARLTILPGWTTDKGSQMVGLRIEMAEGWKTYWRAPGDAGIPPQISWGGSRNIHSAAFHWPVPKVFFEGASRSIGYTRSLTLPMEVFPKAQGQDMHLSGTLDIGVCDEVCVPVQLTFDQPLPRSETRDPAIVAALVNRPATAQEAGIGNVTCKMRPIDGGLRVTTTIDLPNSQTAQAVIIETSDPQVWVSEPDTDQNGRQLTASSDLYHINGDSFALDRSGIRITLLGDHGAVDIMGCRAP